MKKLPVPFFPRDAYGRVTTTHTAANTSTPPLDATKQYTADYYHAASGLSLTKYRAYDPNTARWLSRDPLRGAELSQGDNLYLYVQNDPLNRTDSQGLSSEITRLLTNPTVSDWEDLDGPPLYQMGTDALHNIRKLTGGSNPYPQLIFANVCPKDHPNYVEGSARPSIPGLTVHSVINNTMTLDMHSSGPWGRMDAAFNIPNIINALAGSVVLVKCSGDCQK